MKPEIFATTILGRDMQAQYGWDVRTWELIAEWRADLETNLLGVQSGRQRLKIIREAREHLAQRFGATPEVMRAEERERAEATNKHAETLKRQTERGWFCDMMYAANCMRNTREPGTAQETVQ